MAIDFGDHKVDLSPKDHSTKASPSTDWLRSDVKEDILLIERSSAVRELPRSEAKVRPKASQSMKQVRHVLTYRLQL